MKRWLYGGVALLVGVSLVWAADNVRIPGAGGTVWTLRTTDTAGVHVPHVIVDSGGGGGGGTASTFGAAFPATGTAVGMSQGGNMVAFTGTSNNLNVQCANCSGSGVSAVDEAAFTAGTSVFAPGGGFFQTTATANALTNGQQGMWQMTATRAGFVNLRNAAGTEVGTAGAALRTDPTGTTTQPVSVATWAGGTLGAMANYGTSPGAVLVPGVNAYVTNSNNNGQQAMSGSSPVVLASNQSSIPVAATLGTETTKIIGTVNQSSQYPVGAVIYSASTTGTTGATTATLAATASVTTYICGFSIRANATAAATGNATVTGTLSGTMNFTQWTAPNASGLGVSEMIFNPCYPASAANTAIAVVSAAPGTGGVVSVTAWGYKL